MNLNKNIVLLGNMGSGKSTIGYLLSKNTNFKFLDVDKFIEKEAGLKIYDIFKKKGEDYFRNLEEKVTLKLLKGNGKIVSLGGGGFINKNIRKEILKNHVSFWLNWKNSTIISRIKKSKKRPIALNLNEDNLKRLIIERSKYLFRSAKIKI
jgi:Shikimate kinase